MIGINSLFQIVEGLIGLSPMVFPCSLDVFHVKYLVSCFVRFLIFIIIVIFSGCDFGAWNCCCLFSLYKEGLENVVVLLISVHPNI